MNAPANFPAFAAKLPVKNTSGPTAVLKCGDSAKVLKSILTNSVSAIICDPPYGIDYGNFHWDGEVPGFHIWKECFRVLNPGGYLLAFGSPKTSHELTSVLERVGFVICGRLVWEYRTLVGRIRDTYAAKSTATNKNALYDSYIRAIRWASDRIGDAQGNRVWLTPLALPLSSH